MELSCEPGFVLVASVVVDYAVYEGEIRGRVTTVLTVKVKVGVTREKGFWSLIPNGGFGTRGVFQRSAVRVKLGGKRIAGTLIILKGRRPLFWHGAGCGGGTKDVDGTQSQAGLKSREIVCVIS